ncbi:STAS domain-containing protein [Streptomyces longispororuber]|uniref:STAS domain-containing protein n=1 Tax=Streptomyces longispororuber TaxID=68230 RepID=UPI0033F9154F
MASSNPLTVDVVDALDAVLIRASGDLDLATVPQLADALARTEHRACELDLAQVTFADSTALNLLLAHYRRAAAKGGALRLIGVSEPLRVILDITGTAHLFQPDLGPDLGPGPGPGAEPGADTDGPGPDGPGPGSPG